MTIIIIKIIAQYKNALKAHNCKVSQKQIHFVPQSALEIQPDTLMALMRWSVTFYKAEPEADREHMHTGQQHNHSHSSAVNAPIRIAQTKT